MIGVAVRCRENGSSVIVPLRFEISRSLSPAGEQSWHHGSAALDLTAKGMTPEQIALAREMAQTCQSQNYKNDD